MSDKQVDAADVRVGRYAWFAVLLFAGGWLLYRVRGTFPIFLLGFFIAYAIEPLLNQLEVRGWSRRSAVRFVFLLAFVIALLSALILIPLVIGQIEELYRFYQESYRDVIAEWTANWEARIAAVTPDRLKPIIFLQRAEPARPPTRALADSAALGVQPPPAPKTRLRPVVAERLERFRDRVVPRMLQTGAGWVQRSVTGLFLLLLLPIIVFYFMHEFDALRQRAVFLVPAAQRAEAVAIGSDVNRVLARYFRGQILIAAAFSTSAILILGLWGVIFGMGFTFVLGLFAGLLYLIPFVGMTVNIILSAGIGFFTGTNPALTALLAALTVIVLNIVFDNLVVPRLMGRELGLHPLVVLFALLAGAEFGGVLGMVVAVPVAGALKAVLAHLVPRLTAPVPADVRELVPAIPPRLEEKQRRKRARRSARRSREAPR